MINIETNPYDTMERAATVAFLIDVDFSLSATLSLQRDKDTFTLTSSKHVQGDRELTECEINLITQALQVRLGRHVRGIYVHLKLCYCRRKPLMEIEVRKARTRS